jgi:hypothetical protein
MEPRRGEMESRRECNLLLDDPKGATGDFADVRAIGNALHIISLYAPCPTPGLHIITAQGMVILCHRFIVGKRRKSTGKEFSPLIVLLHMFNELCRKTFVFLRSVLSVEDAISMFLHAGATEEVAAIEAIHRVEDLLAVPNKQSECRLIIAMKIRGIELQLAVIAEVRIHAGSKPCGE